MMQKKLKLQIDFIIEIYNIKYINLKKIKQHLAFVNYLN